MGRKSREKSSRGETRWHGAPAISFEPRGDNGIIKAHWSPEEHQQMLVQISDGLPGMKSGIDGLIEELKSILAQFDAIAIAATLSLMVLVASSEDEYSGPWSIPHLEYLLSMILALPRPPAPKEVTSDIIQQVVTLAADIMDKVRTYYVFSASAQGQSEVALSMRLHSLVVRGDGYPQHIHHLTEQLLAAIDGFLRNRLNVIGQSVLRFMELARDQVVSRLNAEMDTRREALRQALGKADANAVAQAIADTASPAAAELFRVELEDRALMDLMSSQIGENAGFLQPDKWAAWPLSSTLVTKRPFIKDGDRYYLFAVSGLLGNAPRHVEALVERLDPAYFAVPYREHRHDVTVRLASDYLTECIRPDQSAVHLYYPDPDTGDTTELDAMLLVGDTLIALEAKGGLLSDPARRGAPSVAEDVRRTVGDAFEQGTRVLRFVDSADTVTFLDSKGAQLLSVRGSDFSRRLVISVTYDHMGVVNVSLPQLRSLGGLPGQGWPWSVGIHDLAAVTEVLHSPAALLHYVQRRLAANLPMVNSFDELDYLGAYIKDGLSAVLNPGERGLDAVMLTSHTDSLDEYFYGIDAPHPPDMPRRKVPIGVSTLLTRLDEQRPQGHIAASLAVLDADEATLHRLNGAILKADREATDTRLLINCRDTVFAFGRLKQAPDSSILGERLRHDLRSGLKVIGFFWKGSIESAECDFFIASS